MAATLIVGMEERDSAKRRRQGEYRQDLELQMRERRAAKQRERLQDMRVDASGWLDPEKRPERLKPLGGVHWTEQRGRRDERVRPYHTLFMYDRDDHATGGTQAAAGVYPGSHIDQAYSYMGARDLGYSGGGGSLVQPITLPYPDNRPIIIHGGGGGGGPQTTRTVVEYRDDGTARQLRNLLDQVQSDKDRMRRDNEDFQRRMLRNLEDERRRMHDQEQDAKRRMEKIRQEAEESRKEAERQRREAERLKREAATRPKTAEPANPRSQNDMEEYRRRLLADRQRMDDLLKSANKPKAPTKDVWDLHILRRPRFHLNLPPTPVFDDRANTDNVRDFNNLKLRDFGCRNEFRQSYPNVPVTNRQLEEQQEALLRHQGINMQDRGFYTDRPREKPRTLEMEPRRAVSRPGWLDRTTTPLEHVQKKRSKTHRGFTSNSESRPRNRGKLKLSDLRSYSSETLTDDTWIRPSDTAVV